MRLTASCVAWHGQAVLLRGASGSGKSDLSWRAIVQTEADLVADDGVHIERRGDSLVASPVLPGLLELRGVGVIKMAHVASAEVKLIVDLQSDMPRMAAQHFEAFLGITVPHIKLDALQAIAPYRLKIALETIGRDGFADEGVYPWP
jgi:HPr kinase/phosphorylase